MATPISPAGGPVNPLSEITSRREYVSVLNHLWRALSFIPKQLFKLIEKIITIFKDHFKSSSPPILPSLNERQITHDSQPTLQPIFQKQVDASLPVEKQRLLESNKDSKSETNDLEAEELQEYSISDLFHPLDNPVEPSPPPPSPTPVDKEEHQENSVFPFVETQGIDSAALVPSPNLDIIDVPDKGNCLFCALAVGLRKQYGDQEDIQEKLNWKIDPQQLNRNLSQADALLQPPSQLLRQQAADYLEVHQKDVEVEAALVTALELQNEALNENIANTQGPLNILEEDIENLKKGLNQKKVNQEHLLKQITEQETQYNQLVSQAFTTQEHFSLKTISSYLEASKQEGFYAGVAQIQALSRYYDIPIQVIYNKGKPNEFIETYNSDSLREPIKIAYVNAHNPNRPANHFQYVPSP